MGQDPEVDVPFIFYDPGVPNIYHQYLESFHFIDKKSKA
jgi:hypothetical protein